MKRLVEFIKNIFKDHIFLEIMEFIERSVSKILALGALFVLAYSIVMLFKAIIFSLILHNPGEAELHDVSLDFFEFTLRQLLALFLSVLIIYEVVENVTVYLSKQKFSIELVVITALTALARKIIIFDTHKQSANDLAFISISLLAVAGGFWLIKKHFPRE